MEETGFKYSSFLGQLALSGIILYLYKLYDANSGKLLNELIYMHIITQKNQFCR